MTGSVHFPHEFSELSCTIGDCEYAESEFLDLKLKSFERFDEANSSLVRHFRS